MSERRFTPIAYWEWAQANPDLASKTKKCVNCAGSGRLEEEDCMCPDCGHEHTAPERKCPYCDGKGEIDLGREIYKGQVAEDEKRWEAWTGVQTGGAG